MKKIYAALLAAGFLTACSEQQTTENQETQPEQAAPIMSIQVEPLTSETEKFTALSNAVFATEGNLAINRETATFSSRKGTMNITFARSVTQPADYAAWFKNQAQVHFYQVTNSAEYFEANKGGNGMGPTATEWMALARTEKGDLSLCLGYGDMTLDPNIPNLNVCGLYAPATK